MKNIILLHGALGAAQELVPLKQELDAYFSVHIFEFPGHGKTPLKDGFSISVFAEALKSFAEENELLDAAIFGYSMGGYVALYLAAEYPEFCGEIITLGTKFHWTNESASEEIKKLNPQKILEKIPKFANYLSELHGYQNWMENMENTAVLMSDLGQNELLNSRFSSIQNICHIGLGDLDNMVSENETIEAVRKISNAQFFKLPDTVHPLNRLDAKLLSNQIIRVLL